MDIKKIFNKKGFTLTEIMLALIIIGIISVLTLPTMLNSIQTREYKSGVKKAHTVVSESFDSMKIDENYIYKNYNNDNVSATAFRNVYAKYFGFVNRQGEVNADVLKSSEDFAQKYYPLNDTTTNVDPALYSGGGFQARNGMMIMVGKLPKPYDTTSTALIISIDIDGPKKGDNQLGRDVFCFEVMPSDNVLPVGAKSTEENTTSFDYKTYCQTDTTGGNNLNGIACTYSAINTAEYMDTLADRLGGQNCDGTWVKATGTCQCRRGKKWNETEKKCECPSNYITGDDGRCHNEINDKCILKASGGEDCCEHDCENQSFNDKKDKWECNNGELVDGRCSGCSNGTDPLDDGTTCCDVGKRSDDGKSCICDKGKEWVNASKKCESTCPTGLERNTDNGLCECPAGQTAINGNSMCCPNTKTVDSTTLNLITKESGSKCIYDCGEGTYDETNNKCVCDIDSTWSAGKCSCVGKSHSKWVVENGKGGCVCDSGREEKGGKCVCKNSSVEDDCGCNASKGFIANSSSDPTKQCECDTTKGFRKQIGGSECVCASALRKISDSGVCVCRDELHRVSLNGDCVCDSSNHWVENGNVCSCDSKNGFVEKDGKCVCITGEEVNGKCEKTCIDGATYESGACVCNVSGAILSGNRCVCEGRLFIIQDKNGNYECGCPKGQTKSGTTCISNGGDCSSITGKYYDSKENKCYCADSLIEETNGTCACPSGWSQDMEMGTTTVKIDDSTYTRMYCKPSKICVCDGCVWISQGGANGTCDCGEGLNYSDLDTLCYCNGIDVTTKNTDEDTLKGKYSCDCNSSKLVYQYEESEAAYICSPPGDYYELSTEADLNEAKPLLGTYDFKLMTNVTIDGTWEPWGTVDKPFNGTFDGNGNTITITNNFGSSENDYVGLFGYTGTDCKISNLNLVIKGNITGKNYVGALVGYNNCEIKNVTVTGSDTSNITGEEGVGGFVGYNKGSIQYASADNFNILGTKYFGGFAGINSSSILKSSADSKIKVGTEAKQGSYAGGFVGKMDSYSIVMNSASRGEKVYSGTYAGGFVGYFERGSISYVYTLSEASSDVSPDNFVGYYDTTKPKDVYVLRSFFVDDTHMEEHVNMDTLYGRSLSELKDPATYLCAEWILVTCEWAYDANKEIYPQIISEFGMDVCEDYNCASNKQYFSTDGTCADYNIISIDPAECPAVSEVCPTNAHVGKDGKCVECASRQYWDSVDKKCACDETQEWSDIEKNCVCKNKSTSVYFEGKGCVDCVAGGATKVGDTCDCASGTFDYDIGRCVTNECEKYDGIYDSVEKTCILPSPLTYDSAEDKVTCLSETTITIAQDADLNYLSRCTYDGDITGGGNSWSKDKTFVLAENIDMDETKIDKGYSGTFKPINNFQGTFKGGTKNTIENLTLNLPTSDNVGLFNTVSENAKITDLYLYNFNITGNYNVGALAGRANVKSASLERILVNKTILTGDSNVGGLIGHLIPQDSATTIKYISAIAKIKANNNQGGLAGYVNSADADKNFYLQKSYALSLFNAVNSTTGGLFGNVGINVIVASASDTSEASLNTQKSYYYAKGVSTAVGNNSAGISTNLRTGNITENSCPANMTSESTYSCAAGITYPRFAFVSDYDTNVIVVNSFIGK